MIEILYTTFLFLILAYVIKNVIWPKPRPELITINMNSDTPPYNVNRMHGISFAYHGYRHRETNEPITVYDVKDGVVLFTHANNNHANTIRVSLAQFNSDYIRMNY